MEVEKSNRGLIGMILKAEIACSFLLGNSKVKD